MPEPFDLLSLDLPEHTEVPRLLREHPDVAPLRFSNDEYLLEAGDCSRHIYLLLKGTCSIGRPKDDRETGRPMSIVDATVDHPVFVGEMAYFSQQPRIASVQSCMNTWTLRLSPAHLEAIIGSYPQLTQCLCQQSTERLRELIQLLERFQDLHDLRGQSSFLQAGEVLYSAGATCDTLWQIVDGIVEETDASGAVAILKPGGEGGVALAGARSFFGGGPHDSTARARTTVMALGIPLSRREAACRAFPEQVMALIPPPHAASQD
jgi:CRP-like cAMP-binding protein